MVRFRHQRGCLRGARTGRPARPSGPLPATISCSVRTRSCGRSPTSTPPTMQATSSWLTSPRRGPRSWTQIASIWPKPGAGSAPLQTQERPVCWFLPAAGRSPFRGKCRHLRQWSGVKPSNGDIELDQVVEADRRPAGDVFVAAGEHHRPLDHLLDRLDLFGS